jgi:hypothetical protein
VKLTAPVATFRLRGGKVAAVVAWFCAIWMIVVTPMLATMNAMPYQTWAWLFLFALFGLVLAWITAITRRGDALGMMRRGSPDTVEADENGIRCKQLAIPRDQIGAAIYEKLRQVHQVTIAHEDGRAIAIHVRDKDEADALLDAARVGLRHRSLSLSVGRVQSSAMRLVLGTVFVIAIFATLPTSVMMLMSIDKHIDGALSSFLVAWGAVIVSWYLLYRRHVTIGRDGVRVKRKFLGYAGMKVRDEGRSVVLVSGSKRLRIPTSSAQEARSFVKRIEEARAAFQERRATYHELLARNERSMKEWRASLQAVLQQNNYRLSLDREDLIDVLDDASASLEQRVGAALALSDRVRIENAIATTADPKLRVALQSAIEENDTALEDVIGYARRA